MDPFEDLSTSGPSPDNPDLFHSEDVTHADTQTSTTEIRRILRTKHVHNIVSRREQAVQTYETFRVVHTGLGQIRFERETTFHHRQKQKGTIRVDFSQSVSSDFEFDLQQFRNPVEPETPLFHMPRPAIKREGDSYEEENEINTILPHFRLTALASSNGYRTSNSINSRDCPSRMPLSRSRYESVQRAASSPQRLDVGGYRNDGEGEYTMSGGLGIARNRGRGAG